MKDFYQILGMQKPPAQDTAANINENSAIAAIDAEYTQTNIKKLLDPHGLPFSTSFVQKHSDLVKQYQKNPILYDAPQKHFKHFNSNIYQIQTATNDYESCDDIFTLIRIKNKNFSYEQIAATEQLAIDVTAEDLTPELAVEIFTDFLEGDYFGKAIPRLAAYFKAGIAKSKQEKLKEEILYEGIHLVLSEYKSATTLLHGLKKITDYIKQTVHISMPFCALLLQNKYFRNLFSYALHHQWKVTNDHKSYLNLLYTYIAYFITYTHLHRISPYLPLFVLNFWAAISKPKLQRLESNYFTGFNGIESGKKYLNYFNLIAALPINNTETQKDILQNFKMTKLLYFFDKSFNSNLAMQSAAQEHRLQSYKILDWFPVLKDTTSKAVLVNLFIQAGLQFQRAAQCLNIPEEKMADEHLALSCYTHAISLSHNTSLDIELYAHILCLKYITHFQFDFPELKTTIAQLQERCLWIADMFPLLEYEQSNVDLENNTVDILPVMRSLLHTLVNIIEINKNAHENDAIEIDHEYVNVLSHAYEACVKRWYEDRYSEDNEYDEEKIRTSLMESLLKKNKWGLHNVYKNLQSPWVMVKRDANGWVSPGQSLSIPQSVAKTFSSIDGIEINQSTGNIVFVATSWRWWQPQNNRVLTLFDLQEMLQKNISSAIFSLDPPDRHMTYHPYNQMRIFPSSLYQTHFANTMLLTDYTIKHLTIGEEAQAQYPFNMRPIANLINHMPKHLQKIIYDFHQGQRQESTHRFWIEAQEVQTYIKNETEQNAHLIKLAIPEIKMVVKQQLMKRNLDGTMVDEDEQEEGWQIYVKNSTTEIRSMNLELRPSLVFLQNQTELYLIDNKKLSGPINTAPYREKLGLLFKQERTRDGQVIKNDSNNAFLYQIVKDLSVDLKKHHHFSTEYVFVQEFTAHYDEFAKYLPEFERLKQLSRISVFIRLMNSLNTSNNQKMDELETLFNNTNHWQKRKATIDAGIAKLKEQYQTAYLEEHKRLNDLLGPEFTMFRNKLKKSTLIDEYFNKITELKNKVDNHMGVAQYNREAIFNQLYELFYKQLKSKLGYFSYRNLLNNFLDGNTSQLSIKLAEVEFDNAIEAICKNYKFITKNELIDVIRGDDTILPGIITRLATEHLAEYKTANDNEITKASKFIEEEKTDLRQKIIALKKLKITFYQLGVGTTPDEVDLKDICLWVPASIGKNSNYIVYGGVNINPNIKCDQSNSQHLETVMKQTFSSGRTSFTAQELLEQTKNKDTRATLNPLYYMRLEEAYNELRKQGKNPSEITAQWKAQYANQGSSDLSSSSSAAAGGAAGGGGNSKGGGNDGQKPPDDPPPQLFENKFPNDQIAKAETLTYENLCQISGSFNYVVLENGTLIVGKKSNFPGGGHIDLANGKPVLAAGELRAHRGRIKYFDNSSGHYLPSGLSAKRAAQKAFINFGFKDIAGKYIEKIWVPDPNLPRGGKWKPVQ